MCRINRDKIILAIEKGYMATDEGNIIGIKGKILRGVINKRNYRVFTLRDGKKNRLIFNHHIVAFQKFGEMLFEKGMEVRHLNGNSLDNSWLNIRIGTHQQNMMDKSAEVRLTSAMKATSHIRKYDKNEVRDFYAKNGWKKTMDNFKISSKGTLSYVLNS